MSQSEKLVLAQVYNNSAEANIALGMLRSAGIPCILDNEIAFTTFGIQLTPADGIRLMVRASELAQAQELLSSCGDN